jgi:glycine dehydrogenase subunit 2
MNKYRSVDKWDAECKASLASLAGFLARHPLSPDQMGQGFMACLFELQEFVIELTGMKGVSFATPGGAQGEFAGLAMIRAYHRARGDEERTDLLVANTARASNHIAAKAAGYQVREVARDAQGKLDIDSLQRQVGIRTAGLLLAHTSSLGVVDRRITEVAQIVRDAGGLLFYDGAFNALVGKARPLELGFDLAYWDLRSIFPLSRGGGTGGGCLSSSERLAPFLPIPLVVKLGEEYSLLTDQERPQSIGRLVAFAGNVGSLLQAYVYARMLGREGAAQVGPFATLNARYLKARLANSGLDIPFPQCGATHQVRVNLGHQLEQRGVSTTDFAKRLLDNGYYAAVAFGSMPDSLLIEPTESATKEDLDGFVAALLQVHREIDISPDMAKRAPHNLPVGRLDTVKAAEDLDLAYRHE